MHCSKCETDNAVGARFCNQCGAPLNQRCPKCNFENAPEAKFCSQCATSLALPSPSPPTATGAADGERKTVTALFADIKGSTELMRDLDPEEARGVIDPVLQLMMDAVHRYDGYVVQSAGDGIFALFGAPVAHEDHPQRAVHAAIAMRDALRRRDVDQPGQQSRSASAST